MSVERSGVGAKFADADTLGDSIDREHMLANLRRKMFAESGDPPRIGRFTVLERLGAGASGVVFAALDPKLERRVAIKLLRSDRSRGIDNTARDRLLREARTLARTSHPNIVAVHEVGEFEGRVFLAMEYVEGSTLSEWIRRGPHRWDTVVSLFVQAGRGLAAAHATGLIHRDFKPDNVLVDTSDHVRVADFGLARVFDPEAMASELANTLASNEAAYEGPGLTATGALVGTPAYMAPELFSGTEASPASDQFAFAMTLDEALHGTRRYGGRTLAELAANIAGDNPQPRDDATCPRWLRRVLRRALAGDPAKRYPSMAALVADLSRERRPARTAALVAAAGFGAAAVWFATTDTEADPCRTAGEELRAQWTAATQERIRTAFEQTGHPDAQDQFDRVQTGLDHYVKRWAALSKQTCEASHAPEPPAQTLLARRTLCLNHARYAAEATIDALSAAADRDVVAAAAVMLPRDQRLDVCASDEVVSAAVAEPPPPHLRAPLEELDRELAAATATRISGHVHEAEEMYNAALPRAREIGYAPTEAEALLGLGLCYVDMLRPKDAVGKLREAVLAADRGRADEQRAMALGELSRKLADLGQLDEAQAALKQADAAYDRAGLVDPKYRIKLILSKAWVADIAGDTEEAARLFKVVDELGRANPGLEWPRVTALHGRGRLHYGRGELEAAADFYKQALALTRTTVGERSPLVSQGLVNVGATLFAMDKADEAEAVFERALAIRLLYVGEDDPQLTSLYLNLGAIAFQRGEPADAIPYFEHAHRLAERQRPNHPSAQMALSNIASALSRLGRYEEALAKHEKVLALRRETYGDKHRKTAASRTRVGMALLRLGRFDEATPHFESTRATTLELFGPDHTDLAWILSGLAEAQLFGGDPRAALATLDAAAVPAEQEGTTTAVRAALDWTRAQALDALGRNPARAMELAQRALTRARKASLTNDEEEISAWIREHS